MKKLYLSYLLTGLLLTTIGISAQQTYPIYVTPSLTPPYSLTLSEYSQIGSQRLIVTIMVRDVTLTNLPVRLHLKMENTAGVTIETIPNVAVAPIFLSGGEVSVLFGDDMRDYFNINNLQFKGYSKDEYRRTGQLPEGFYRFTVEVRSFASGRLISNQGTTMAYIAFGKPPVLKTPDNGVELGQISGMPLTFSWLPSTVIASGAGIQYTFEMWEMRVPGIHPNIIAASMPVFYSATQMHTSLVIHPATLMLEPGMNYAWRVTASDVMGQVPFAQGGHSEVRSFIYQCRCDSITGFKVELKGQEVNYRWTPADNHTSFTIEMENPVSGWSKSEQVYNNKYNFKSDPDKIYRARVQAICKGNEMNPSEFSAWQTVNIPPLPKQEDICPECECRKADPEPPITNFELRTDLQPSDTITTPSGTNIFIIKSVVPQGNGIYKGQFLYWVKIWGVKFLCDYWDLKVNTNNHIVDMNFESVYDPTFLVDVDATQDYLNQLGDAVNDLTSGGSSQNNNIELDFVIPKNPEYHYDAESGTITIMDENGNSHEIELPKDSEGNAIFPATITDNQGNSYEVTKEEDGSVKIEKTQNQEPEKQTKEFAIFYNNIEFNSIDTLFIIKGFNKNINLFFKKQTNNQWSSVNALWNMNDNKNNINSKSFSIENSETTDFQITTKQESSAKDSLILFVKYLDIDVEQAIIKTLLEIKNLETHCNNLVDSLDKALEYEQWDKPFIMGRDNKYVKRGMHKYFEEPSEQYEPCGFPIFDLFYQIYVTDVLIAKYDGKFEELIKQIDSVMKQNTDGSYKINTDFIQSVLNQIELMHCTTKTDAETRYKTMINDITIQNISTNE